MLTKLVLSIYLRDIYNYSEVCINSKKIKW